MRTTLLSLACCTFIGSATAQLQVNPQLGLTFTDLTDDNAQVHTTSALGFQLGADLRLGGRFYFQPGIHFARSATVVKITALDTAVIEDNLIRTTLKLKALAGLKIVDAGAFKLRVMAGPTYDVLLSVDNKDDKIAFNKDDYNAGSFNMDGGVGVDLSVFTIETGVSYGLSKTYKDSGVLKSDAKYFTFYATIGLVFGGG